MRCLRLGLVGVGVVVFVLLVAVRPGFGQTPGFEDVPEGHFAEDAIRWAAEEGITVGVGNNQFGIGQTLTRYEMVTFLCRAFAPGVCGNGTRGSDTFGDVPVDHWANFSIGWAVEGGITSGVSATEFGGSLTLTREQIATFLFRAKGSPGGGSLGSDVYTDVPADRSQWANQPIGWAYDQGISGGIASGIFGFGTFVAREEMVLFLCRALASDTCTPSQTPIPPSGGGTTVSPTTIVPEDKDALVGDRAALVALYHATDGPSWQQDGGWLSDAPLGDWHGVVTDRSGRVIAVDLAFNDLSGEIPPELGSMPNLEFLDLTGNELSGEIPPQLGSLSSLEWLALRGNELSGEIPPQLGSIPNLIVLQLSQNQLSGEIPPQLASLSSLEFLELSLNQLSGSIPPELGNLANLEDLSLYSNGLSGEIPAQLGDLLQLDFLLLDRNRLSGNIPSELGSLSNLTRLTLDRNELDGDIPPELGSLSKLKWLILNENRLSGDIPPELGSLSELLWLILSDNQLGGDMPPELGSLSSLIRLRLGGSNSLTGCIPGPLWDAPNSDLAEVGLPSCDGADDGEGLTSQFSSPPASLGLDPYYEKYLDAGGISIVSSSRVPDEALLRVRDIINEMFSDQPGLYDAMSGVRVAITSQGSLLHELPEISGDSTGDQPAVYFTRLRLVIAPVESILCLSTDRSLGDTLVHELAHAVDFADPIPDFRTRLESVYEDAMEAGLWPNTYASSNVLEYWAETVSIWFGVAYDIGLDNRSELSMYDPAIAALIGEVFGNAEVSSSCHSP